MSELQLNRGIAIFVVDCCQFGFIWMFVLKLSLWSVLTWLVVEQRKAVFLLTLFDSINETIQFRNVCITPHPCHSHVVVDCCQFSPSWIFELKMELMDCADLVGGTAEQICIFPDHI